MTKQVNVLNDVIKERERQERLRAEGKFFMTCADAMPLAEKLAVLSEETGEVAHEVCDALARGGSEPVSKLRLYTELVQVAAVAVAWAESLDVRHPEAKR